MKYSDTTKTDAESGSAGKRQALIVAGPTASGKTDFAIRLAREFNGEIINADSRQVYRGLDIGTNKGRITPQGVITEVDGTILQPFEVEKSGVTGWLFDVCGPGERFDVSRFYKLTAALLQHLDQRGKTPIIVGGTGLYIDSLIKGYQLPPAKPDQELRMELEKLTPPALLSLLQELDARRAEELNESDRHNPRRLIRAIEIAKQEPTSLENVTGEADLKDARKLMKNWEFKLYYPVYDKVQLFHRIDERVFSMFAQGLVKETRAAIENGYGQSEILKGIGYKQIRMYLNEELTLAEAVAAVQRAHRQYAKRQITWFEGEGRGYEFERKEFSGV